MAAPAGFNGKARMSCEVPACDTAGLDPSPAKAAGEEQCDLASRNVDGDDVDVVARLEKESAVPTQLTGDTTEEAVDSSELDGAVRAPILEAGATHIISGGRFFPPVRPARTNVCCVVMW